MPQIPTNISEKVSSKGQVCKDLVIWPRGKMTCWDYHGKPNVYPLAILEWEYNKLRLTDRDAEWLRTYSNMQQNFVGYTVQINRSGTNVQLKSARFHKGETDPVWLVLPI